FLAGKLGRRVEKKPGDFTGRRFDFSRKGMQVGLVARRDLQTSRLDLDKVLLNEKSAQPRTNPRSGHQKWPPVSVHVRGPPRGYPGHCGPHVRIAVSCGNRWQMPEGSVCSRPRFERGCHCEQPHAYHVSQGTRSVKVIASSLRKGNIVEVDDKLYV